MAIVANEIEETHAWERLEESDAPVRINYINREPLYGGEPGNDAVQVVRLPGSVQNAHFYQTTHFRQTSLFSG